MRSLTGTRSTTRRPTPTPLLRGCGALGAVRCFAARSTVPCPSTSTGSSTFHAQSCPAGCRCRRKMRLRRCSSSTTGGRRWMRSRQSRTRSSRAAAIQARSSARWDTRSCARTRASTTTSRLTSRGSGFDAAPAPLRHAERLSQPPAGWQHDTRHGARRSKRIRSRFASTGASHFIGRATLLGETTPSSPSGSPCAGLDAYETVTGPRVFVRE